jgi:hypothetical protein
LQGGCSRPTAVCAVLRCACAPLPLCCNTHVVWCAGLAGAYLFVLLWNPCLPFSLHPGSPC